MANRHGLAKAAALLGVARRPLSCLGRRKDKYTKAQATKKERRERGLAINYKMRGKAMYGVYGGNTVERDIDSSGVRITIDDNDVEEEKEEVEHDCA